VTARQGEVVEHSGLNALSQTTEVKKLLTSFAFPQLYVVEEMNFQIKCIIGTKQKSKTMIIFTDSSGL